MHWVFQVHSGLIRRCIFSKSYFGCVLRKTAPRINLASLYRSYRYGKWQKDCVGQKMTWKIGLLCVVALALSLYSVCFPYMFFCFCGAHRVLETDVTEHLVWSLIPWSIVFKSYIPSANFKGKMLTWIVVNRMSLFNKNSVGYGIETSVEWSDQGYKAKIIKGWYIFMYSFAQTVAQAHWQADDVKTSESLRGKVRF